MSRKLEDLNNHLFAQLEKIGNEDLTGDELKEEIDRSKAIKEIASTIICNATLALEATKIQAEYSRTTPKTPEFLLSKQD